jgi:sugar diacid utilization regulator
VLAASARPRSAETDGSGGGSLQAAHATIESFLNHHAPEAIVAARDDEVIGIVPGPAGGALAHVKDLASRCRSATEGHHPGAVVGIGVGGPCVRATEIAGSYSQARRSLETTRRHALRGGVVAFAELGIQRLLLQVPDVGGLRSFAHEVLGQALDQDSGGGTEHLRTLVAYFRANCSPRAAAVGLHLHPNTVSYRIRRIEELTGLSLNDHRDRLLAQVAVEILAPSGET